MELFTIGFPTAFSLHTLAYCFIGVFLGTLIGVLPGIGALTAISLLMPVSFYLDPMTALVMLAGVYYGAEYGGSTASILLNLPGTASNAITALDGYPMAKQGRAGIALFVTTYASFIGGCLGVVLLMLVAPTVARLAVAVGPSEYFAILLFGLIIAATISQGSPLKGLSMVVLGMLIGTIGIDVNSGEYRYAFGVVDLFDGVSLVALALGMFGVAEVMHAIASQTDRGKIEDVTWRSMIPNWADVRKTLIPILRGTGVGSIVGPLPGAGPTIASVMAYGLEKRVSKTPQNFGNGAIEGISSPEAANNAAVQTAFIPTLSLGIPGSPTMAIMLGALMVHGIAPGPKFMVENPEMFWGLIASFWIGNVILVGLNFPMIGIWVRLLQIPYRLLYPVILSLVCAGVFTLGLNVFEVWVVLVFGIFGYGLRLLGFWPAPLLIGFILGPLLEENLRRAMLIAGGDVMVLLQRPVTSLILAFTVIVLGWTIWRALRGQNGGGFAIRDE